MEITNKFLKVNGSKIHYLEAGKGDPIVFLHGMPTYSYVWRNILPNLADVAHCIAPDLIGMGESDKPDIDYRVFDHIDYIENFIEQLGLENITLVLHGWGSVVGFEYARRHPQKIKGIAFFEARIRPTINWEMMSLPVQQFASVLGRPEESYNAVVEQNYLVERLLPSGAVRVLTDEEMECYRKPFSTIPSRKVLWRYIQDLPLGDGPKDVVELISCYSDWLQQAEFPKLMLYAMPGFITTIDTVQWAKDHLPNLQLACLEDVMHFAQESEPKLFSDILRKWYLGFSSH